MKNTGDNNQVIDEEISIEGIESIFDEPSLEETKIDDEILDSLGEDIETKEDTENKEEVPLGGKEEEESSEEPPLEDEKPQEKKEDVEKPQPGNSRIKDLIELGIIEDVRVATSEDDEEGTLLSERDDLTQDQIRSIIKMQKEKKGEELSKDYIKRDNLSDHHLEIIEIMRNGGDLSQIFQNPNQALKRPFEGKDLSDVNVQREVAMTYFTTQKNHTPKEAQALIAQKEKDFELDTFATEVVGAYNNAFDGYLSKVKEDKIRERQEEVKMLADRKKELTKAFKEKGLRENVFSSVVSAVTQPGKDGTLPVHKALEDILSNPKENYEVLLHMLNKDAYKELYKLNTKKDSTEEVLRLFDALPKDKAKQTKEDKGQLSEIEEELSKIVIKV